MLFYPNERLALFVDGANLYGIVKSLGFDMDYKKLFALFAQKGILVRAHYYTAISEDAEFSPLRPLIDWLSFNSWTVTTKPLKEFTDGQGHHRAKGNIGVELAVDALEIVPHVDHIVILSGDGDLCRLVEALKRKGVRVSIVSTVQAKVSTCSEDLRKLADNFIDMADLVQFVGRDLVVQRVNSNVKVSGS